MTKVINFNDYVQVDYNADEGAISYTTDNQEARELLENETVQDIIAGVLFEYDSKTTPFAEERINAVEYQRGGFIEHLKQYKHDQSPLGDFASDALIDPNFPTVDDKDTIRNYLIDNDACQGALDAFNEMWNRYQK
ncbi:YozE family protein [Salinicoccus roseus]|uniref:YozE family protein n=1 Tax=Salinicoccus roseus TaxID=45670 RepID=UPI003D9FDD11